MAIPKLNKRQKRLYALRGVVAGLPDEVRAQIEATRKKMETIVIAEGDEGGLALALLAAEYNLAVACRKMRSKSLRA